MIVVTPFIPALAARIGTVRFLAACYVVAAISLVAFARRTTSSSGSFCASSLNARCRASSWSARSGSTRSRPTRTRPPRRDLRLASFSAGFALGPIIIQVSGYDGLGTVLRRRRCRCCWRWRHCIAARRIVPPVEHAPARAMFGFVLRSPSAAAAGLGYGAIEACAARLPDRLCRTPGLGREQRRHCSSPPWASAT